MSKVVNGIVVIENQAIPQPADMGDDDDSQDRLITFNWLRSIV